MKCTDAPEILKIRRQIAANPSLSAEAVKALVDRIDQIRWSHEECSPYCGCWQKARRAAGAPFKVAA